MKTEDLIQNLVKKSVPIKRVRTPIKNLILWSAVAFFSVGVGAAAIGIREDIESALTDPFVLLNLILTVSLSIASAFSAFILGIPGLKSRASFFIPSVTLSVWITLLGFQYFSSHQKHGIGSGLSCIENAVFFAILPGVVLFTFLNKSVPLNLRMTGLLATLAALAVGGLGSQLLCTDNHPAHLFAWHVLPVVILGSLGVVIGKIAIKKAWL